MTAQGVGVVGVDERTDPDFLRYLVHFLAGANLKLDRPIGANPPISSPFDSVFLSGGRIPPGGEFPQGRWTQLWSTDILRA
jgi:hypothetical protein